jgi:hypothetical protein
MADEDREEPDALSVLIEAGLLRCGLPPPSPERLAEQRDMGVVGILNAARNRLAVRKRAQDFLNAPEQKRP